MLYTIRNEKGTMVAEVSGEVANGIMTGSAGFWRSYKTKTHEDSCYELTEDGVFTLRPGINGLLKVYLWAGYIMIPEKS